MQCITELTPPTAVTHSVCLPFLSAKATNLVVAKRSLIQVFETKTIFGQSDNANKDAEVETSPQDVAAGTFDRSYFSNDIAYERLENKTKLVLIAEYALSGTITSLQKIKPLQTKSGGDALLVSFRDAKFSMIQWDPQTHSIANTSIHFYESELGKNPWMDDAAEYGTYLTVDPANRCAALSFGSRHLAFLPMRRSADDIAEDDDLELDSPMGGTANAKEETSARKKEKEAAELGGLTPYLSSFVLKTTDFQEDITNPIHLTFLHEYREPAIGILYASQGPTCANLLERKDPLKYTVFTLDFEGREVTTILSIPNLPFDLFEIRPLPPPVGGAILIGSNEVIHVDQAGKAKALAVNEMANLGSSFAMTDQSDAGLRLENCAVEQLNDNGDLLIVLSNGELAILSFKLDGRTVSGLQVHKVAADKGGTLLSAGASCASNLGRGRIFVGSEETDAVLLYCQGRAPPLSRKRSHADMVADGLDFDEEEDDDDDIYGGDSSPVLERRRSSAVGLSSAESLTFRIHDRLPNLAPVGDITFGPTPSVEKQHEDVSQSAPKAPLSLIAPIGRGADGGLIAMRQEILPTILREDPMRRVRAIWAINPKPLAVPASADDPAAGDGEAGFSAEALYDKFVMTSEASSEGVEQSFIYSVTNNGLQRSVRGDFNTDGAALEVGLMLSGARIVQVLASEIRTYDSDFGVSQLLPLLTESTGEPFKVVSASFCDPWLLLIDDNSAVHFLSMNSEGDLEETEIGGHFTDTKWLSGCLYMSGAARDEPLVFLLSAQGILQIYNLSNLSECQYSSQGLSYSPSTFGPDFVVRRAAAKETLTEILVADIGDSVHSSPYLVARTANDDLVAYQPYHNPEIAASDPFTKGLRWKKISQPHLAKYSEDPALEAETSGRQALLKSFANIGGYKTIVMLGTSPSCVLKEASSAPRVISLGLSAIKTFTSFNTAKYDKGFMYISTDGTARECQLPANTRYGDTGWVMEKIPLGQSVERVVWHQPAGVYIISTSSTISFKLPQDDYHFEWAKEDTSFLPHQTNSKIKILDPTTWSIVDELEDFQLEEKTLDLQIMDLVASEKTLKRKSYVVVGTALVFGEDQLTEGNVWILEVIDAVPEPGRPETRHKFKLVTKLQSKGAVTALSEVGTEGFLVAGQGQKCYVRGLKEDNSLLPTAFMDMQTYVTFLKTLAGTGFLLMCDLVKGVWLTAYTEQPNYRMVLLSKCPPNIEVLAGDFLPWEKHLYIVVADADSNIHIFQYDPENLQSVSGTHLIHKSSFHIGHSPIGLTRLPSTLAPSVATTDVTNGEAMDVDSVDPTKPQEQLLYTSKSGVLALVTPLDENMYRRLNTLQGYLSGQLEHPCALNPRAYRAVADEGVASRGVVDGTILRRWGELSSARRAEACAKAGVEEWVVRSDLEFVGGGGLGYL